MTLSEIDGAVLAFEARAFQVGGTKAQAIRTAFGWSSSTYYHRLARLIDDPAAENADPLLVRRLQRDRARRRRTRFEGPQANRSHR